LKRRLDSFYDFYREKFVIQARLALLYGNLAGLVDPFFAAKRANLAQWGCLCLKSIHSAGGEGLNRASGSFEAG
jgi:hypothetical protein